MTEVKKYKLSITKDYCHDWTVENAVREILQNALDSPAKMDYEFLGNMLRITNEGTSIPTEALLLGVTTKRDDEDSVGGKGEGFKIAVAILLRNNIEVTIYNGEVVWVPSFEYCPTFGADVLTFSEYSQLGGTRLTFHLKGLSEDHIKGIRHDCLYLREEPFETLKGATGSVITSFPGEVYVGGLYVCSDDRLQYSYDFHPSALPLNRDRKSVAQWSLIESTSKLLQSALGVGEVVDMIYDDVYDMQAPSYRLDCDVREGCYEKFQSEHEGCVLVKGEEDKEASNKRYDAKPIITKSPLFREVVIASPSYSEKLKEFTNTDRAAKLSPAQLLSQVVFQLEGLTSDEREKLEEVVQQMINRNAIWG